MHNMICVTLVCRQGGELTCFSLFKYLDLSKALTWGFLLRRHNGINVTLCMMVVLIALYLFVPLSVSLTIS